MRRMMRSVLSGTTPPWAATEAVDTRRRTADAVFRFAFAVNAAFTLFWVATYRHRLDVLLRGLPGRLGLGGQDLRRRPVLLRDLGRDLWAIKGALLRWFVGFTREERRDAFSSRMDRPYNVADLVSRYPRSEESGSQT